MPARSPSSLKYNALNATIKLILNNPDLLHMHTIPKRLKKDLAQECHNALTNFRKSLMIATRRKQLTEQRFKTLVNSKEHDCIPEKFKKEENFSRKRLSTLEAKTLSKLAAIIN